MSFLDAYVIITGIGTYLNIKRIKSLRPQKRGMLFILSIFIIYSSSCIVSPLRIESYSGLCLFFRVCYMCCTSFNLRSYVIRNCLRQTRAIRRRMIFNCIMIYLGRLKSRNRICYSFLPPEIFPFFIILAQCLSSLAYARTQITQRLANLRSEHIRRGSHTRVGSLQTAGVVTLFRQRDGDIRHYPILISDEPALLKPPKSLPIALIGPAAVAASASIRCSSAFMA